MSDSKVNVPDTTSGTEAVRTFEVLVGAEQVHVQGVALVDPATGAARGPLTDAELRAAPVQVTGQAANGGGAAGNPVMVAGSNGGVVRNILVNAAGSVDCVVWNNVAVHGREGNGLPVSGNPILTAGSDGTNARTINTDTSGRQIVVGAAAAGAAMTGNPLLVAGSDGSVVRTLATSGSGILLVAGPSANGSPAVGDPVMISGSDGANARTLKTDNTGALTVGNSAKATYVGSIAGISNAGGPLISIEAGAAKTVRLRKVVIVNPGKQTTAGLRALRLSRTTTAGTVGAITPSPMQTTDAPFSGAVRVQNSGTEGAWMLSFPVFVPAAVGAFEPLVIDFDDVNKAPTIEPGTANGIVLMDPGAAGASDFAAYVVFTEE